MLLVSPELLLEFELTGFETLDDRLEVGTSFGLDLWRARIHSLWERMRSYFSQPNEVDALLRRARDQYRSVLNLTLFPSLYLHTLSSKTAATEDEFSDVSVASVGVDPSHLSMFPEELIKTRFRFLQMHSHLAFILLGCFDSRRFEPCAALPSPFTSDMNAIASVISIEDALEWMYKNKKRLLPTKLVINRHAAQRHRLEEASPSHAGNFLKTVFVQVMRTMSPICRMSSSLPMVPFSVNFVGEEGYDAGGLLRETWTEMCLEIMSSALPLFIPCPNFRANVGSNRSKWIVRSSSTSPSHLQLFEWLGTFLAMAWRARERLNLDLSHSFWKQLVGSDRSITLADIEQEDFHFVSWITSLRRHASDAAEYKAQGVSVTDVLGICNFTMTMPDDSVHELIPHGSMRTLTWDDVGDFADLCVTARVHDSWQQMEAVRRGFSAFFRDGTLERLSPQSLEVALCGEPGFDVSELRSRSFVERELGQVADFLWDTLERFDYREKELFLRFVTGCSRLPRSDSLSGGQETFSVSVLHNQGVPMDAMLPEAHTCSFALDLPLYSSREILEERLRYAIHHCQVIDLM